MTIYTKKGDKGTSNLFASKTRKRIYKSDLFFEVLGNLDELNSFIGIVVAAIKKEKIFRLESNLRLDVLLENVQKDLLTIGSIIAGSKLQFDSMKTKKLEKVIDVLEERLSILKNFILPGGNEIAAQLHFSRSLVRRTERSVVKLNLNKDFEFKKKNIVENRIIPYLNRLSDFFFILAREVNLSKGVKEKIWKKN